MALRLHNSVVRGEIDNRAPGSVCGRIWLLGRAEPVELRLKGNCHRDIAGRLLQIENPAPKLGDHTDLNRLQEGVVGDMTASRKVSAPDVTVKEGETVPEPKGNSVYIEWFSDANGRIVIESTDCRLTLSERAWTMSDAQHQQQLEANHQAIRDWLDRIDPARRRDEEPYDPETDKPMDEFEWEKSLKESDALTDKYMALHERFGDSPEAERRIAHEMGWDFLEEALEADERGALPVPEKTDADEVPPLEANPLTEGVDWVRDEHGHIHHPLQLKMFNVAQDMWHDCDERGLLGETGDADLHDMIFQAQCTGAKLAGALNSLAYDDDMHESGFVVAYLKRALSYLNKSLAGVDRVAAKNLLPVERLEKFRASLHDIRQQILELMDRFRQKQS